MHSEVNSGSNAQSDVATYWLHNDHLGTPVLVTTSTRTERWRWENDPFGRSDPIEYQVAGQDVSPDDSPTYGTCGSGSQCSIWSKTYSVTGAKNMRVHFSAFNIDAGSSRTNKDYVRLYQSDGTTTLADLTGNLGDHWSPWSGGSQIKVELFADNQTNSGGGFTIDKLEHATNSRFVMQLRMSGQLWDDDAKASYNYQRWYRREDGRYLAPDPIGLNGGDLGYFGYAHANSLRWIDPSGKFSTSANIGALPRPIDTRPGGLGTIRTIPRGISHTPRSQGLPAKGATPASTADNSRFGDLVEIWPEGAFPGFPPFDGMSPDCRSEPPIPNQMCQELSEVQRARICKMANPNDTGVFSRCWSSQHMQFVECGQWTACTDTGAIECIYCAIGMPRGQ